MSSSSSGWCTFAKINGWIGIGISFIDMYVTYRFMKANESSAMSEQGKKSTRTAFGIAVGVTAVLGVLQYLLFKFPEYCNIIGMMMVALFAASVMRGMVFGAHKQ
jgi:hypothetical protein